MFQIGPFELMVLAIVGLLVLGPERLPGYAKQAAQLLRTLRELATGAQQQLRDELGPEFADVDLRNLNPRHVVRRAIFDEDFDFADLDPRKRARETFLDDDMRAATDPRRWLDADGEADATPARANGNGRRGYAEGSPVPMTKPITPPATKPVSAPTPSTGLGVPQSTVNGTSRPRPRPSPRPRPTYDDDVT